MAVLALELSTSSAKALLYEPDRGVLHTEEERYPASCTVTELSLADVLACMFRTGRRTADHARQTGIPVEGLGLCTIWHSLFVRGNHREALTPVITWADTRAAETVKRARENEELHQRLYEKTGCVIHSMYPLWQYKALREQNKLDPPKGSRVSSLAEEMLAALTSVRAVSRNLASGSALWALEGGWNEESMEISGIRESMLPEVTEADHTFTLNEEAARLLGLSAGLPVTPAGADGAMTQLGAGLENMTFSAGTSGALRIACNRPHTPASRSNWCYSLLPEVYLAGAATSGAGNCVDRLLKSTLRGTYGAGELEKALGGEIPREAPIFMPFLFGERCPGWKDDRKGGFDRPVERYSAPVLYYSVLEGILFNLTDCFQALTSALPAPSGILLSGGMTSSGLFCEMAAARFGHALTAVSGEHTSAVGAALCACKAVGILRDARPPRPASGRKIIPKERFAADPERYARYHDLLATDDLYM